MLQKMGESYEYIREYTENKIDYIKLSTAEMLSLGIARMMMMMCVGILAFISFIFFSIAAAIAIGEWLGSMALGMAAMGLASLFLTIILFLLRKPLLFNPTVDKVVEMFFDNEDD